MQVTKRTYAAPVNEQPFFGFAVKTERSGRRMKNSSRQSIRRPARAKRRWRKSPSAAGGRLLPARLGEAALRFNQAFLLAPEQSVVYHGLAAIAQIRFNDLDSAEELFGSRASSPIR